MTDCLKTPNSRNQVSGAEPGNMLWPADLSCCTGTSTLVHLSIKAAERLRERVPQTLFTLPGMDAYPPVTLISLLTYACATGIHETEEIRFRMTTDPALKFLGGNRQPELAILLRFRRQFQGVLIEALAILLQAVRIRHIEGSCFSRCEALSGAPAGQSALEVMAAGEARARIDRAIRADCAALDV